MDGRLGEIKLARMPSLSFTAPWWIVIVQMEASRVEKGLDAVAIWAQGQAGWGRFHLLQ